MIEPIKIQGLKQFQRNLKALDSDLPKALRIAFNAAADIVVRGAVPGIPTKTGRAKRSVKARSTRTQSRVVGGGNRAPHYPWLDFGGAVGRNKSIRRPWIKEGRYIYNAYFAAKRSGEFEEVLTKALIGVAESAGIEVT